MQYKTIVIALLQQRPLMHEQLRQERKLLTTLEMYARELKASHEDWKERISELRPGSHPSQIASEALEVAIKEMEDRLPPVTMDQEALSLDEAVAFINNTRMLPD